MKSDPPVVAFVSLGDWEAWLKRQDDSAAGIWMKLAKQSCATRTLSKQDALDGALCHGWIDGQLRAFDEEYWLVRYSPRGKRSKWSLRNRERAEELVGAGRMQPRGQAEIERAKVDGRWAAAYAPQSRMTVPDDLGKALAARAKAAKFFAELDSANRYAVLYRVTEAKRPETRARWIERIVAMLERGETFHPVRKAKPPKK